MNNCNLYHGDCIPIMNKLQKDGVVVDAIIVDPPYGTTKCQWDTIIPYDKMWEAIKGVRRDTTPILIFGMEPFSSFLRISNIEEYRYDIYWQKERATNILQLKKRPGKVIENISVFYKGQCTYNPQMVIYDGPRRSNKVKSGKIGTLVDAGGKPVNEYNDNGTRYPLQIVQYKRDILTSNLHPTQKPVALMEYLILTYTNPGETVLDFTMGSGTTGVACMNTGRKFIGIELDDKYYGIAEKRINKITSSG